MVDYAGNDPEVCWREPVHLPFVIEAHLKKNRGCNQHENTGCKHSGIYSMRVSLTDMKMPVNYPLPSKPVEYAP